MQFIDLKLNTANFYMKGKQKFVCTYFLMIIHLFNPFKMEERG